jgi:hypothetical protein
MDSALPDVNPASQSEQLLISNAVAALIKLAGHTEAQRAGAASAQNALKSLGHGDGRLDFSVSLSRKGVRIDGALVTGEMRRKLVDVDLPFNEGALAVALGLQRVD